MAITVTRIGDRIAVQSPYNAAFVTKAKKLAGKWDADRRAWVFPAEVEADARRVLTEIYGEDGSASVERVRLRVLTDYAKDEGGQGSCVYAGREVARAWGRDSGAKLGDDVVLVSGGYGSGGSRINWHIKERDGTVVDLLRVPVTIARRLVAEQPEGFRIVNNDGTEIEAAPAADNIVQFKA